MATCVKCGFQNREGSSFCINPNCGAYLDWQNPAEAQVEARAPTTAVAQRPPEVRRIGITAVMRPGSLTVAPGEAAECEVTVRNTGTVVDQFTVSVGGPVAGWATIVPLSLSLFPGADGKTRITIRPPRASFTPAGPMGLRVTVTSREDPTTQAVEEGLLTVGSFTDLTVGELMPQISQGRRSTEHRLAVTNNGNLPVRTTLAATDPEAALDFELRPSTLGIEPGEAASSRILLRARKRIWFGAPRVHLFKVRLQNEGQSPMARDGTMRQTATVPPGIVPLALGAVALLAVAVPLWVFAGKNPGLGGKPAPVGLGAPSTTASAPPSLGVSASASPSNNPEPNPPQQPPPTPISLAPAATWHGWTPLTSGGTTNAAANATVYNGKLYLFGIGINDHGHWVDVFDGSNWGGWHPVMGLLPSTASDSATVYNGRLYLFGINMNDQGHYMNVFDGSNWTGWNRLTIGGTTNVGDTAIVYNGQLYLFAIGINDHGHWMASLEGTNWGTWHPVPTTLLSTLSDAVTVFNGKLYLFGIGMNDQYHYMNVFDGNAWTGWTQVPGGGTTNASNAAAVYGGKLYLFGISIVDHGQWVSVYDGSSWSRWAPLPGGETTQLPDAATTFNNKLYLFENGPSDQHYYVDVLST